MKRLIIAIALVVGVLGCLVGILLEKQHQSQVSVVPPPPVSVTSKSWELIQIGEPIRSIDPQDTLFKKAGQAFVADYKLMRLPGDFTIFWYVVQTPTDTILVNAEYYELDCDDKDFCLRYIVDYDRLAVWHKKHSVPLKRKT